MANSNLRILFPGILLTILLLGQAYPDTPENITKCITTGLRGRNTPERGGVNVFRLDYGEEVYAVRTTASKETIGNLTANWYKIIRYNGESGWVFGGFLDMGKIQQNQLLAGQINHPGEAMDPEVDIVYRDISDKSIPGSLSWISVSRSNSKGREEYNGEMVFTGHKVTGKELLFLKQPNRPASLVFAEDSFSGDEYQDVSFKISDRNKDSYADIEVTMSKGSTDGGTLNAYVLTWRPGLSCFTLDESLSSELGQWEANEHNGAKKEGNGGERFDKY